MEPDYYPTNAIGPRITVDTLDSFRSRIPAADRFIRIAGPIVKRIERIAAEVSLTDSEVVHWAVTQLESDLGLRD